MSLALLFGIATVYILSSLLFLITTYMFNRYITIQALFISFVPVLNTLSLVLGLITAFREWYNENKAKVLFDGRNTTAQKPKPKSLKLKVPQIPTPKN